MSSTSSIQPDVGEAMRVPARRYGVLLSRRGRQNPYMTLIGALLSHRTKDEVAEKAEERLFGKASTSEGTLLLSESKIRKLIYPVVFCRRKARMIREASKILVEKHGGKVPMDGELLTELPGVGGKTADCALCFAFGKAVMPIDAHVEVVSKRLGISDEGDGSEAVREKLHLLIPPRKRMAANWLLVEFGKEFCGSIRPRCPPCPIMGFRKRRARSLYARVG
ncbi:MAG: endonuclease III [Candidatus Brockarchaeota archaeon]|nr:endonuclease III [Candidatus Brockarchaeota archaeon]